MNRQLPESSSGPRSRQPWTESLEELKDLALELERFDPSIDQNDPEYIKMRQEEYDKGWEEFFKEGGGPPDWVTATPDLFSKKWQSYNQIINEIEKTHDLTDEKLPPTPLEKTVESLRKRQALDQSRRIIVCGNEGAGKTTMIYEFLKKNDPIESRGYFEYNIESRTYDTIYPDYKATYELVMWEVGGDAKVAPDMIDCPLRRADPIENASYFVILDLSEPVKIWPTLEMIIIRLKIGFYNKIFSMTKTEGIDKTEFLGKRSTERLQKISDPKDKDLLDLYPLPIVIIGTKYEVFQDFEPKTKKTVCRILRIVAHKYGASLYFYRRENASDHTLVNNLFSHYAWGTPYPKGKGISKDPMNKPLAIPHGSDSFDEINGSSEVGVMKEWTLNDCRKIYEAEIGACPPKPQPLPYDRWDSNFEYPAINGWLKNKWTELEKDLSLAPDPSYYTNFPWVKGTQ